MSGPEWFLVGFGCALAIGIAACRASYRLGACDGYRWTKEPDHPGMQKAGDAIKKMEMHR